MSYNLDTQAMKNAISITYSDNDDLAEMISTLTTGDSVTITGLTGTVRENIDETVIIDIDGVEDISKSDLEDDLEDELEEDEEEEIEEEILGEEPPASTIISIISGKPDEEE